MHKDEEAEIRIQKMLDKLKCNTCKYNFVLSVYTSNRDPGLLDSLEAGNVHRVCMAFADEGIAEIGTFSGGGCEEWEENTKQRSDIIDKADKTVNNRIFKNISKGVKTWI